MKSTSKLVLRRQVLVELEADDLRNVAGAATTAYNSCNCPSNTQYCITRGYRCDTIICL